MIYGITGKIGSGKDLATYFIKDYFDVIIDVDKVGKFFFEEKEFEIYKIFGVEKKEELVKKVFNDYKYMIKLEKILHPSMKLFVKRIFKNIKKYLYNDKVYKRNILINCALLHKLKFDKICDKIIIIDSDKKIRLDRLIKNRNLNYEDALLRIEYHEKYHFLNEKNMNRLVKFGKEMKKNILKNKKYIIIYNNSSKEELEKQVKEVIYGRI
jgi:dephospho-CoA kinase